ncbi:MAG TPA: 23S rRNA (pseudouridine(1915)-N(3))-methyltransferase RlmH [Terriglobales bacterium]|nr:23S rRNA (pseudouridine(1915)-N(3))-methyltransferase RlmH [Terriglobales bacterium]
MKIKIAWIGKTKEPAIDSLSAEYLKRLSRDAEGLTVKDEAALLRLAHNKHRLVLLDSRGKQFTSEEFAEFIREHLEKNALPLVFAIGAANGFTDETRKAASTVISLGKITMPHELARVVLIEQVYRAFTILNRHPYHLGH